MSKAFVFLNCGMGTHGSIIAQMKKILGVSQASGLSGVYDIVAEVNADSHKGIAEIVRKFRLIDNITSCLTMIVAERKIRGTEEMTIN